MCQKKLQNFSRRFNNVALREVNIEELRSLGNLLLDMIDSGTLESDMVNEARKQLLGLADLRSRLPGIITPPDPTDEASERDLEHLAKELDDLAQRESGVNRERQLLVARIQEDERALAEIQARLQVSREELKGWDQEKDLIDDYKQTLHQSQSIVGRRMLANIEVQIDLVKAKVAAADKTWDDVRAFLKMLCGITC